MKKLLSLLLALCMCLSIGVLLSACKEHEHSPTSYYQNNETHHWKKCDADTCSEDLERAEHTFEISVTTDDKHTWACVCGKAYMEDHDFGEGTVVQQAVKGTPGIVEYVCKKCEHKKTTYVQYEPKTEVNGGTAASILSLEGMTKYTLDIDGDYEIVGGGGKGTYTYNGTTIFEEDSEWYWTLENNTPYQYYKSSGNWVKVTDETVEERYEGRVKALEGLIYDIDFVDDFDYNEQEKCYVGSNIEAAYFNDIAGDFGFKNKVYDNVKLYFEDDQLVKLVFEKNGKKMTATISYEEVEFTVPTVQ